jgi:hypothetical protein
VPFKLIGVPLALTHWLPLVFNMVKPSSTGALDSELLDNSELLLDEVAELLLDEGFLPPPPPPQAVKATRQPLKMLTRNHLFVEYIGESCWVL